MADKKSTAKVAESDKDISKAKEQAAKRRTEVTKFYKDNLPHLKAQLEYEQLLTDIEQTRVKRIQAQMFLAQTYGSPEEGEEGAEDVAEAKKEFSEAVDSVKQSFRSLKTK
jgi:hypothetical protein